jgi:hypothetical protein
MVSKRIWDAHEWEGSFAGCLEPPSYRFGLARGVSPEEAFRRMRVAHNQVYGKTKIWSCGPDYRVRVCDAASKKPPGTVWAAAGHNVELRHLTNLLFPGLP